MHCVSFKRKLAAVHLDKSISFFKRFSVELQQQAQQVHVVPMRSFSVSYFVHKRSVVNP